MTMPLVEEIEQLQNCRTHQECAEWLLTCPFSKLMTYEMAIKARLRTRGFLVGIEHLDSLLASIRAPRENGTPPWSEPDEKLGDFIRAIAAGHYREEDQPVPPVGGEGEPI